MNANANVVGNLPSLPLFAPELTLILGILAVLTWDLLARGRAKKVGIAILALTSLALSALFAIRFTIRLNPPELLFGGLLASDRFAHVFRILSAAVTGVVIVFSLPGAADDAHFNDRQRALGEFYVLLLTVALGMNLMAMSHNLLLIYLSLELVSVLSFVLAGYKLSDHRSAEAALKYVVFGGVASGVLLYGMSWLFGLTQSLDLGLIGERVRLASDQRIPGAVIIAVVCMLAGFGYKISAAPFHMWTPDVYDGAPTPVTAFLSVGPKAAGFAVLLRFFAEALSLGGDGSSIVDGSLWQVIGGLLAMASMIVGNLSALGQSSVKRMLAYSSIAHAGYMLLGFCVFSDAGRAAILFYIATYCLMNLGAFLVVLAVAERSGGDESIKAFTGLGARAPMLAAAMTIFLFSLTGLPPFAGFVGKFYIFAALVRAGGSYNWLLAGVGVLNSVVSLFYYARVMRAMYLTASTRADGLAVRGVHAALMATLAVPTLALGIYWVPVYDFVANSLVMAH